MKVTLSQTFQVGRGLIFNDLQTVQVSATVFAKLFKFACTWVSLLAGRAASAVLASAEFVLDRGQHRPQIKFRKEDIRKSVSVCSLHLLLQNEDNNFDSMLIVTSVAAETGLSTV